MKFSTIQHVPVEVMRNHVAELVADEKARGGRGALLRVAANLNTFYNNLHSFLKGKIGPSEKMLETLKLEARTVYVRKTKGSKADV